MDGERLAALIVLGPLALGLLALGEAGHRGRIRFNLGAMTESDTSPEAWDRAHRCLGRWISFAAVPLLVGVGAVAVSPVAAIGPVVVLACATTVVVVWVGISAGLRRLDP